MTTKTVQSYTDQQRSAIETRQVSVSLSAGAGCGKTFVLTERYLSHLDPRDPDALAPEQIGQLVAITFTDRAAREMRDRIRRRCYERLQACSPVVAPYWSQLLRSLDGARINTIHGFCATMLRSRAVEAGLDPQFSVLEQAQAETLLATAVDDELRQRISDQDETALELAVQFGVDGVRGMMRQLVLDCTPRQLDRWRALSPEELLENWQTFYEALLPRIAAEVVQSEPAQTLMTLMREHLPTNAKMLTRREALMAVLDRLAAGDSGELALRLETIAENARVVGGGGAKAWPSSEVYEQFRDAATDLRKVVGEVAGIAAFDPRSAASAATLGTQLLELAEGAYHRYAKQKRELRVLDFNDLLIQTQALLCEGTGRDVARQLSTGITLLLVDEFQDTDPVQVDLVKALCGEGLTTGKLFFVGDFKQSIYRFRGAKPHVFRELRSETPSTGRLQLSQNFRSQRAILDFVNALFSAEMPDYEPLGPHREQVAPLPAVEFLWAPANVSGESAEELRDREADWVARRLRELIDSGERIVWDEESETPSVRSAKPGDVAILLRALTSVDTYEAALRRYDLDYYLVGGHAFYAQQEVFDLLNLLRAVEDSGDLVSLAGVLRSPFFGIADETLFWLAQHPGGLAEGLLGRELSPFVSSEQWHQVRHAAETLTHLRACKDRLKISELIELALERTGYDAVLLHEFLGARKLANLVKLQEQARGFQRGDFLGLTDFIARLAEFVANQPDEALAATHSEDTDVVRLMTVHQSKGLEFPIVVVPDMNRPPHSGANRAHLHEQLGPLARPLVGEGETRACCGYDLWRYAEKAEEAAESTRLLYVATTRAADFLLLSGGVQNVGDARSPWMKTLSRRFDLATGRFLGDLPPGQARPSVRVTIEPPSKVSQASRKNRVEVADLAKYLEESQQTGESTRPGVARLAPNPSARREFSFSRLSGSLHRKYERLDEAAWPVADGDPRQLGTLVHAVLGAIDFSKNVEVWPLVEMFAEQHVPDSPGEVSEAANMIERFVASSRAREIARAKQTHAEVEFLLPWNTDRAGLEHAALRGYLDLLYQDSDHNWRILDFKTNRLRPGGARAAAAAYEMQMYVYALAAERILKVPPVGLVLHFLRTGDEIEFEWNDAARARVVTMVSEAMASARTEPEVGLALQGL